MLHLFDRHTFGSAVVVLYGGPESQNHDAVVVGNGIGRTIAVKKLPVVPVVDWTERVAYLDDEAVELELEMLIWFQ
jgi:hypothetical protein